MQSFQHTKIVHEMPENCAFRFIGKSILSGEVVHASCRRTDDVIKVKIDGHSHAYDYTPESLRNDFDDHIYRVVAHNLTGWQKEHLAANTMRAENELNVINEHLDVSEALTRIIDIRKNLEE